MTFGQERGASDPDFYHVHHGPYTVRVFGQEDEVTDTALGYLQDNKFFGGPDLMLGLEQAHIPMTVDENGNEVPLYSDKLKAVLRRDSPELVSMIVKPIFDEFEPDTDQELVPAETDDTFSTGAATTTNGQGVLLRQIIQAANIPGQRLEIDPHFPDNI